MGAGHPEIGGNVLLKIRDKVGFHWDPQPFQSFVDDPETSDVVIWETDGTRNLDRIFRGSADAMSRFFFGLPGEEKPIQELFPLIIQAHGLVGKVIEAAVIGLILESGEDPKKYWVQQ